MPIFNWYYICQIKYKRVPTIQNFKDLAEKRLEEVKLLFDARDFDGAKYLSGYVIECALKARICLILDIDFPDSGEIGKLYKSHDFSRLVTLAGLKNLLDNRKNQSQDFTNNWSIVTSWNENLRYNIGTFNRVDIQELLIAIEDENDGVFTWIKTLW